VNVVEEFARADPWVAAWRAYPDVDEATDEAMPACVDMTERFVAFARSRGVEARTVTADDAEDGEVWTHVFARLPDGTNVDWTAPQFHNLRSEPTYLPVPLVWRGTAADHPVVKFGREVVT
jgi:hypothetical protein